ncbi:DUF1707 domain-containing protein [Dactylosporangium sp. NPDC000555]|uniref:DUF1707 SHOCT-like domain-containing protein n=1 Tax=Dactylosporangium sp. NPDC000555 TaxID=3154260 RepID=UPI0033262D86
MDTSDLRAGDADRERVAQWLRTALDEGRLNLHEYDERLRETYAAKTYADLDRLLIDLPVADPATQALDLPAKSRVLGGVDQRWQRSPDGHYPGATRAWLANMWQSWARTIAICVGIWGVTSVLSGDLGYFWPGWVAGPWGVVLLVQTITGLMSGESQRWAAKQARKEAEREVRRRAKGESES